MTPRRAAVTKAAGEPAILLAMPFLTMGGAEASISQLCRQLKSLGFQIFVVTTEAALPSEGDASHWFSPHIATIYHLPRLLHPRYWAGFVFELIQRRSIAAIWQAGSSFIYDHLPEVRQVFPGMAVVDLLLNPVGHTGNYFKYNYLIDHVVTEHEGMMEWLIRHGELPENISVIPNGVDVERFSPQPPKDWRTGGPRIAGGPFVVGFFGRFSPEKGPDTFLKIAERFWDRPGFEFLLFGTGRIKPALQSLCAQYRLAERVKFPGFVETRDYLPCCDLTIVCSRLDGRPNIVMESLAMGIPVVASRVGGIPDMLSAGQGGLLCGPEQVEEFSKAIEELAADRPRHAELAAAARRCAKNSFSITAAGARYAELFHRLIQRRAPLSRPVRPQDLPVSSRFAPFEYQAATSSRARCLSHFGRSVLLPTHLSGNLRTLRLYRQLTRGGSAGEILKWFDPEYYGRRYPETTHLRVPLFWHYLLSGCWEPRNPSPLFNASYYLYAHKDVAAAGLNPLLHYLAAGRSEGRSCLPAEGVNRPGDPLNYSEEM